MGNHRRTALSSSSSSFSVSPLPVGAMPISRTKLRETEQHTQQNDDDDEEKRAKIRHIGAPPALQWAADVPDLAGKLKARVGLNGPQVVEALRLPLVRVEGAALQAISMASEGRVKKMVGFFFTTLRRHREWDAEQIRAYLDDATAAACGDCPTVGTCAICGETREAPWVGVDRGPER